MASAVGEGNQPEINIRRLCLSLVSNEYTMSKLYLITSNLEAKTILISICGKITAEIVRNLREEIIPFLKLFDDPISLIVDVREAHGDPLDAIDEMRELWSQYEQTTIGQLVRVFANDLDDHGSKITDQFHLKGIRKINVTSMEKAIHYCESFAESTS